MVDLHFVGYEKEARYHDALGICCSAHVRFKAETLRQVVLTLFPEFMVGLFEVRPCVRKLRYIQNDEDLKANDCNPFFVAGEVYESIDFNGGTYGIKGYDGRIGCAHFEVCED